MLVIMICYRSYIYIYEDYYLKFYLLFKYLNLFYFILFVYVCMNRDLFKEFGTQDCRSWQVQNLQGKPAGWRPVKHLFCNLS